MEIPQSQKPGRIETESLRELEGIHTHLQQRQLVREQRKLSRLLSLFELPNLWSAIKHEEIVIEHHHAAHPEIPVDAPDLHQFDEICRIPHFEVAPTI
jgi:hypothetical protein